LTNSLSQIIAEQHCYGDNFRTDIEFRKLQGGDLAFEKKGYGNTQVLINAYMRTFVSVEPVENNDTERLRRLCNQIETSMRNLKTLDVKTDIISDNVKLKNSE